MAVSPLNPIARLRGSLHTSTKERFWRSDRLMSTVDSTALQAVGVLIRSALPEAVWIGKEDLHAGLNGEPNMVGQFLAADPGQ